MVVCRLVSLDMSDTKDCSTRKHQSVSWTCLIQRTAAIDMLLVYRLVSHDLSDTKDCITKIVVMKTPVMAGNSVNVVVQHVSMCF